MDNDVPPVGCERDAAIATACGCTFEEYNNHGRIDVRWYDRDGKWMQSPRYSTDLTSAYSLGAEAARMGFAEEYSKALYVEAGTIFNKVPLTVPTLTWRELSIIAHASADARSAAWLRAWREWKGREGGGTCQR